LAELGARSDTWVELAVGADGRQHAIVHRGADKVGELPSVALAPPFPVSQELVRVGKDQLWASVVRPRSFDPKRKYPVIVDVYGGPHHQQVTAAPQILRQWQADHGAIVVAIDGRGTPARGRKWQRGVAGDFSAFLDDQVQGLQALAAK